MHGRYPSSIILAFSDEHPPVLQRFPWIITSYANARTELLEKEARYVSVLEVQNREDAISAIGKETSAFHSSDSFLDMVSGRLFDRIGPEFATEGIQDVTGIQLVVTTCVDPSQTSEFNAWYDTMHIPDVLATGFFFAAYRYVHRADESTLFLALYETDRREISTIPAKVRTRFRPQWVEAGRWSELVSVEVSSMYAVVNERQAAL